MPCTDPDHGNLHAWPPANSSGPTARLFICRCETLCGYCPFSTTDYERDANAVFVALRDHVKATHLKSLDYEKVTLEQGYRGRVKDDMCPCEMKGIAKGLWVPRGKKEGSDESLFPEEMDAKGGRGASSRVGMKKATGVVDEGGDNEGLIEKRRAKKMKVIKSNGTVSAVTVSSKSEDDGEMVEDAERAVKAEAEAVNGSKRTRMSKVDKKQDRPAEDVYEHAPTPNSHVSTRLMLEQQLFPSDDELERLSKPLPDNDEQFNEFRKYQDSQELEANAEAGVNGEGGTYEDGGEAEKALELVLLQGQLNNIVMWANNYEYGKRVREMLTDAAKLCHSRVSEHR